MLRASVSITSNDPTVRFLLPFLIFFFILEGKTFAQSTEFLTWTSIAAEKSFDKKWKVSLEEELRLLAGSRLRSSFLDLEVTYQCSNRLDVTGAYRFIVRPNELAMRLYADFTYSQPLSDWTVKGRIRMQHEFITNKQDEYYLRPQLTIAYRISKKWEPFVEEELFYHIFFNEGDQFDESRTSAGTRYKFNSHHSIKGYYLFGKEFNVNAAFTANVAGIAYKYEW
jgi:hypothetical protein